ncbi:MAG: hypothetical protein RLQ12_04865 [Cyclobacteriaceae bacterium]
MKPLCHLVLGIALFQIATVNSFSKTFADAKSAGEFYDIPENSEDQIEESGPNKGHDLPWGFGTGKIKNNLSTSVENKDKPTMVGSAYSCKWDQSDDEILKSINFFNKIIVNIAVRQVK